MAHTCFRRSVGLLVLACASQGGVTPGYSQQMIAIGQATTGVLEPTDMRTEDGTYMDVFGLAARGGQTVVLTVQSADFNPVSALYLTTDGKNVQPIRAVSGDLSGRGNVPRVYTIPQDGVYMVAVMSASAGESGNYTLSLAPGGSGQSAASSAAPGEGRSTERWARVAQTAKFVADVDRSHIVPQGSGIYRVWVRRTFYAPTSGEDAYDVALNQMDYDCIRRRTRIVAIHTSLNSRPVYSTPSGLRVGDDWIDWVPESGGEATGEMVCEFARERGL